VPFDNPYNIVIFNRSGFKVIADIKLQLEVLTLFYLLLNYPVLMLIKL
jgi:hypothetical protein